MPWVISWLATRPDAVRTPTPREVLAKLPAFQEEKDRLRQEWGTNIPWADLVLAAIDLSERML